MVDIEKDLKSESINRKWVKYGLERSVFKFPLKLDIHDPRKMDSVHNTKTRDFDVVEMIILKDLGRDHKNEEATLKGSPTTRSVGWTGLLLDLVVSGETLL